MKTIANQLIFCSALFFLGSCVCEDADFIVSPEGIEDAFQVIDAYYENDGQQLYVQFNKGFIESSIQMDTTIFIEGEALNYNYEFFLYYGLIVIPNCSLGCEADRCEVRIRLKSSAEQNTGIRSLEGLLLDGDKDGRAGGDVTVVLEAYHCQ